MATLSTLECVSEGRNTGIPICLLDIFNIKGGFLCPPNYFVPAASLANGGLRAQLLADARSDNKATRIIPFGNFNDFKDASEAPVEEKFGYGDVATVRDGIYDWQYRFRIGGLDLSNRLRSYNRAGNYFIFVDNENQIFGTVGMDEDDNAVMAAIPPIEFYQDVFKVNDGKKTTEYWSKFRFQPRFINEFVAYIQDAEFDVLSSILGMQDVSITLAADATPGIYYATVLAGAAKVNMASLFPTAIITTGLWTALNNTSGAALTISSVALGTGVNAGKVKLTLATTAPPYPAGMTDKVAINLVGPTELAAGNIPGYESLGAALIVHN